MDQTPTVEIPILPDNVPVMMPNLPTERVINQLEQFKAISDELRSRILNIVQLRPATAKQIADRLGVSSGSIGHHLRVLEEAGLVQISARRLVHGIVANYYTRTARIFIYEIPAELSKGGQFRSDITQKAAAEMAEAHQLMSEDPVQVEGFPHARLTEERAQYFKQRLDDLIDELLQEPAEGTGEVYGVLFSMFKSPPYLQNNPVDQSNDKPEGD